KRSHQPVEARWPWMPSRFFDWSCLRKIVRRMVSSLLTPSPHKMKMNRARRLTPLAAVIPCSYSKVRFKTPKANGPERMTELHSRLMHQSLGRPLSAEERALADALEAVFRTGEQDFEAVARALEGGGVKRPSGAKGPWTAAALEQELAAINASLDQA